ncbi:MAG: hypothetical protein ACR5LA_09120 [Wolbachia sp.]|uniref:hypothetical protein n=1 Tax=Wolbachia endosymbiont (group B) of Limnophora tigrina TaxID=3139317 RepID=UPI0035B516A8
MMKFHNKTYVKHTIVQTLLVAVQFLPPIQVALLLSSQCVTLGSRYQNIFKSFNEQQILGAYNIHDER